MHTDVGPSSRETWIVYLSQNRAWLTCIARACSLLQSQTAGLDIGLVQVVGFPFHQSQPHLWGIQDTENLISRRATGGPPKSIFTSEPIYHSFSSYNFPFVCFQNHRRPPWWSFLSKTAECLPLDYRHSNPEGTIKLWRGNSCNKNNFSPNQTLQMERKHNTKIFMCQQ